MSSLPKLAVLSLVVIAIGALQFAVPAFTSKPSHISLSQAIEPYSEQRNFVLANSSSQDYQNVKNGTLYFINEKIVENMQGAKVTTIQQHSISPLLKTKVDIKITGIVARTVLTQSFKNSSDNWVNGVYVFPLPENAAVDHLLMKVGDRKVEGQIKSKEVAKKIYLQAKATGKKASLVAQQRPNIFSNSIANIGPGETVEVSIEYQQRLNFDKQQYSLRFPMTITPRYLNHDFPDQATHEQENPAYLLENMPALAGTNIELQVNLHAGFDVKDIQSEFHPITTKRLSDGSHHIQIASHTATNQDFVLNWRPELGDAPQSAHFSQQVNGDEYGLIMLLPPDKAQLLTQEKQREVIFVLDTSGSMEGDSIKQAKQALLLAVAQLKETDSFNIIEFNTYAQNLWKSPKLADSANKVDATNFVSSLSANGGTEMEAAFNLAFSQKNGQAHTAGTLRQIVFITDGSVGNEESLMQLIGSKLERSRLFTVGIGSAPNSYFMTEAAKIGRGTFTYIGSVNQVQEKMLALLTKLQHPAITDIELQLNASKLASNRQLEFYPNVISDLYMGEPLVLSYRLSNAEIENDSASQYLSNVNIAARYQGKPWQNALDLGAQTRQSGLNVLWAREKINQLSTDKRRAQMHSNSSAAIQDEYKAEITKTALAHHLVSQYTSLIAVDVTPTRPIGTLSQDEKVANHLPKGLTNQSSRTLGHLPQTATPAQLKLILGLLLIGLTVCMHLLTRKKITS